MQPNLLLLFSFICVLLFVFRDLFIAEIPNVRGFFIFILLQMVFYH